MTHSIEVIINRPKLKNDLVEVSVESLLEIATRAASGYDVDLKIDGKRFSATAFTLTAKAGSGLVEATVTFAVSDLKINGENVETAFKVVDPDGGFPLVITKDQYIKVLEFTKSLLENE